MTVCRRVHGRDWLATGTGMELSHLFRQVTVPRRAGVVDSRRVKNTVICSLRDPRTAERLAVARRMPTRTLRGDADRTAAATDRARGPRAAQPDSRSRWYPDHRTGSNRAE
jgi:hypothetical protein